MGDEPRPALLFVHAHPDDETLATGVAMAHYVRRGYPVHVLTCTLGEEGEVIPATLRHLASHASDQLGPYRRGELTRALHHLGVHGHLLGEADDEDAGGENPGHDLPPGRYRDSGMAGTLAAAHPRALAGADPSVVGDQVRAVIEAIEPAVVVTYEDRGGYEHPDHIATHAAVVHALAGIPESRRPTMFAAVTPQSWATADRQWVREHVPEESGLSRPDPDEAYPASVLPDEAVTHVVTGAPADLTARDNALREHATQARASSTGTTPCRTTSPLA